MSHPNCRGAPHDTVRRNREGKEGKEIRREKKKKDERPCAHFIPPGPGSKGSQVLSTYSREAYGLKRKVFHKPPASLSPKEDNLRNLPLRLLGIPFLRGRVEWGGGEHRPIRPPLLSPSRQQISHLTSGTSEEEIEAKRAKINGSAAHPPALTIKNRSICCGFCV